MNKILITLLGLLCSTIIIAQDITGEWNGELKVMGASLRLVFHITKNGDSYSSTMDSPDQGAKGIPMTSTLYESGILTIEMATARILYKGSLSAAREINGIFTQAGQSFPMTLTRNAIAKKEIKRPQTPITPYPYYCEDVKFQNLKDSVTLAGTLTLPQKDGKFPVVILVSGSGPQNRDEEIMGHKPFLIIADYLTKHGIGVLRYDDRGTHQSTGNFAKATTNNFANDAEAAFKYLKTRKDINKKNIGIIGHSEGGIIAPIVASHNKELSFIVLLAGPGKKGGDILLKQQKQIGQAKGISSKDLDKAEQTNRVLYDIISNAKDTASIALKLTDYLKTKIRETNSKLSETEAVAIANEQINQLTSPWMFNFIRYNPAKALEQIKCPVLALNGSKDLQVDATENLLAIEKALKQTGNTHYTTKELPGLNHLFQECATGNPDEYAQIEQTFSPSALEIINEWIQTVIK